MILQANPDPEDLFSTNKVKPFIVLFALFGELDPAEHELNVTEIFCSVFADKTRLVVEVHVTDDWG